VHEPSGGIRSEIAVLENHFDGLREIDDVVVVGVAGKTIRVVVRIEVSSRTARDAPSGAGLRSRVSAL